MGRLGQVMPRTGWEGNPPGWGNWVVGVARVLFLPCLSAPVNSPGKSIHGRHRTVGTVSGNWETGSIA